MIQLEVGARPKLSAREQLEVAQYVEGLLNDTRFQKLLTGMADDVAHAWSKSTLQDQRERAWFTLMGMQLMLKQMQVEIERGQQAKAELGMDKPGVVVEEKRPFAKE